MKGVSVFLGLFMMILLAVVIFNQVKDPCADTGVKRISVSDASAGNLPKVDGCYKAPNNSFTTQYSTSRIKKQKRATSSISTTQGRGSILDRY
ncbi:MAG: hypothetical protein AAF429_03665 [Pseudomonadota bacterium]